eukprot:4288-Heterococcus_DN1.PRE.4
MSLTAVLLAPSTVLNAAAADPASASNGLQLSSSTSRSSSTQQCRAAAVAAARAMCRSAVRRGVVQAVC